MVYHINRQLIAHRGAAGYAPENTLASFNEALARGASFIEFDVMLSADNEAFVFHDENLKRTTNGRGEFGHVDAAYIKTLDAGKWFARRFKGEPVLTLIQALEWLAYTDINANIENTLIAQSGIDIWSNLPTNILTAVHDRKPQIIPCVMENVRGIKIIAINAGNAFSKLPQSIFAIGLHINKPIITSIGAEATKGTIPMTGARNKKGMNNMPANAAVRPLLPPASIPAADSM